ncbi:DUF3147 family protein [Oleiagrimonas soli]|uniref:DUF3147 family protein n=1 Tax=Oleiagrimonas soli TaxID=1543381 RepID=A0A099CVM8_9GAMM|nr:DUF3147 family protein [Oleiagrimonas soli]KGI77741.1 hypothetical protein LF63_0104705 [Oleiagrimonas soli]MBB6183947.1 hypothetical protein [Oleiagrimonas soli]
MPYLIVKYLVTAAVVVAISEIARRSGRVGALIGALPLVSLLALVWMHVEHRSTQTIGNYAYYTFWYVIPTLPMFLVFPWMLQRWGFVWSMLAFCVGTVLIFLLFALVVRRFGVQLL